MFLLITMVVLLITEPCINTSIRSCRLAKVEFYDTMITATSEWTQNAQIILYLYRCWDFSKPLFTSGRTISCSSFPVLSQEPQVSSLSRSHFPITAFSTFVPYIVLWCVLFAAVLPTDISGWKDGHIKARWCCSCPFVSHDGLGCGVTPVRTQCRNGIVQFCLVIRTLW